MSIQVKCEKCGKTQGVPSSLAGRMMKCTGCKTVTQIPAKDQQPIQTPQDENR